MKKGVFLTGIFSGLLIIGQPAGALEEATREVKVSIYAGVEQQREGLFQGEAFLVQVECPDYELVSVKGLFAGRGIPFQKSVASGRWLAIAGIDLNMTPGKYPLEMSLSHEEGTISEKKLFLKVMKKEFPVEYLTLPPEMTELDEEALKRVRDDSAAFSALWNKRGQKNYIKGRFEKPIPGEVTSEFGQKRIINGKPRSPHTGQDLRAAQGDEVRAANSGRVAMIRDCFFSGKSLVIDHGAGIYSMYFHLSEYSVDQGHYVKKGQVIGKAGATGRSTASHLHWGFRVQGARVDPESIMALGAMLDILQ